MLNQITPVLLTYNEQDNIGRTLDQLRWAKDIVVVDSGSTDETLAILAANPTVRVFNRRFDTHATQWRYAIDATQIGTNWILRLDADYSVSDALIAELAHLDPDAPLSAYRIEFDYAIFSRKLLSSLYPSNTILFRRDRISVWDSGHTERWSVNGPVATLRSRVVHDDWKPTGQWLIGQGRYMQREFDRLSVPETGIRRWMRLRPPLMPIAVFLYCLFGKGLIFNGRSGIFYALQRMVAEAVLSLLVLEAELRHDAAYSSSDRSEEH
jgi:glycosyltransferase involved in cell wall biosynthesis